MKDLKHPVLNYALRAEFIDEEKVMLVSEDDAPIISGKVFVDVIRIIQKNGVAVNDIIQQLESQYQLHQIYYAIYYLQNQNYAVEACHEMDIEKAVYWGSLGFDIAKLNMALKQKTVALQSIGDAPVEPFLDAFQSAGIHLSGNPDFEVYVTDDYQDVSFQAINKNAIQKNRPWMLVNPLGINYWIGPVFTPGETACWECLAQRLKNNFPMNVFYQSMTGSDKNLRFKFAFTPESLHSVAHQVAIEVAKWICEGKNENLEGKIVSFDNKTLKTESHIVVKRPQCHICGKTQKLHPEPVQFEKNTNICSSYSGGYREISAEETVENLKHHVSHITGVVSKLVPYHYEQGKPVFNFLSGANRALRSNSLYWLNIHARSANGGKGKNYSQAKAGAICEAIERYSVTYQGDEFTIKTSLEKLGTDGIHPNHCMNFSEKQYQMRDTVNKDCSKFYFLTPVPFNETEEMEWVPIWSVSEQKFKHLPAVFCYTQFPGDDLNLYAYPDSNGSAAGNTIEEATLQGFLELVERDSVAIWWYNMLQMPEVDFLSFNDPYYFRLVDYYKSIHRNIYVIDLTNDMGIPSFGAISYRTDSEKQDIIFGFGAHVDAKIGLERALLEVNQLLPIVNVSEEDRKENKYRISDKEFLEWLKNETIEKNPYLLPDKSKPRKTIADYPALCKPNIYESVMYCVEAARGNNLETLVLDMTRADIGLYVVKVIVPGLRHFWKRLGPGRLYDVPVKMGWKEKAFTEGELNPIGLFI